MKDKILIARVLKPWGIKGYLTLDMFSNNFPLVSKYKEGLFVLKSRDFEKEMKIEEIQKKGEKFLVKFENVSNPEEAKTYSNSKLFCDRDLLLPVKEGEYRFCDLEGLDVYLEKDKVGVVYSILDLKYNFVLEIKKLDGTISRIPFCDDFVGKVDLESHKIEVFGLLDDELE